MKNCRENSDEKNEHFSLKNNRQILKIMIFHIKFLNVWECLNFEKYESTLPTMSTITCKIFREKKEFHTFYDFLKNFEIF